MRRVARLSVAAAMITGALVGVAGAGTSAVRVSPTSSGSRAQRATPIYLDPAFPPLERAVDLVSGMTLAEKARQMNSSRAPAIPRLGIAAWGWWNESNHGVNALTLTPTGEATQLTNTTSYPSDLSLGSTWNPDLVYREAGLISDEAREVAPNQRENLDFYAPTVNLSRDPRWGRNDETWSEDPTLTAALASQYIDGLQGQTQAGVLPASANGYYKAIATLKHFAANNSEVDRFTGSSDMDQRTLREYYTAQFASIIEQSHPGAIMSAYNEVNGVPASADVHLIDTLARETFGFTGYFTSDCDAIFDIENGHAWQPPQARNLLNRIGSTAFANSAGEDLDCNAGYSDAFNYGNTVPAAIGQHITTQTDVYNVGDVDTSVVRLFTARIATGEFDSESRVRWVGLARARLGGEAWVNSETNEARTETPARLATARAVADQSIVLLKNSGVRGRPLLPLQMPHSGPYKMAVMGFFADQPDGMYLGGYSSTQGAAGQAKEISAYRGIKAVVKARDPQATVDFLPGLTGGTTAASLTTVDQASIRAAARYDAVVVVAGTDALTARESMDRDTLDLPGAQADMIRQTEAANPNTIVYLQTVGEVNLSDFASTTHALLWSSFNGEEQGAALADVLTGTVDPSGHLPFTWYTDDNQLSVITDYTIRPTATTDGRTYQYFTGPTSFPFGYGRSYGRFGYSDIRVDHTSVSANGTIAVTARLTNVGTRAGSQVPQLYVSSPFEPASAQRPIKRLAAFRKVTLGPGRSTTIAFTVPVAKLAFWDDRAHRYVVDPGEYGLEISTSSADSDIRLLASVAVSGTIEETPTVVDAKPIQSGDRAAGVAQRVFFEPGTTIDPQLTVAMNDQHLFGYVTKGHSTPLPAGLTVSYRSDDDRVVDVHGGTLKTVGSGIATVTVTVHYHRRMASTRFTVGVDPRADRIGAS